MPARAILYERPADQLLALEPHRAGARGGVRPMIAAQSVVLPMPLRPMIATDSLAELEADVVEHVSAAVERVQPLDREERRRSLVLA